MKGECKVKGILLLTDLLKDVTESVSLPFGPADPSDVCTIAFSSVDVAGVIYRRHTKELPKGVEITHVGMKTGLYTSG